MYISRSLEKVVTKVTQEYPVILVTGPRQVGKTTMLQKLMEGTKRSYVSLDDLNERNIAKTDPELFLQLHKPPVLIDEVQYAPELFTYIKIQVDKNHTPGDFWLTGSQIFKLMSGVRESLAGRAAVLSMTSLSQAELDCVDASPFTVDLDALSARKLGRTPLTHLRFLNVFSMVPCRPSPEGGSPTGRFFTAAISAPTLSAMYGNYPIPLTL